MVKYPKGKPFSIRSAQGPHSGTPEVQVPRGYSKVAALGSVIVALTLLQGISSSNS